jgi:SHS2 domain-containing protein
MGSYRIVEEIALADCAFDVDGRDLPDLFETAARALAELMVDPATLASTVRRTIALDASALDLLLYDWLSELIFRKDRDLEVYTRSSVRIAGDGPVHLTAEVEGGVLDPALVELRSDAKAVTFHQFALAPVEGGWRARIVIDI